MFRSPAMRREDYDEEWIGVALSRLVITEDRAKCWTWTGAHNQSGYAVFPRWSAKFYNGGARGRHTSGRKRLRGAVLIHRLVYCTEVGPITEGMVIDHLCNNRGCCNPIHLAMVTQRENLLRSDRSSASQNRARDVCPKCSGPWNPRANGGRYCKACFREYKRRWRAQRVACGGDPA